MRRTILALLLCCALTAATGCTGHEDRNPSGTESEISAISADEIEYDALDYVTLGEYKHLPVTLAQDYEVDENDLRDYVNNNIIAYNPYLLEADHDTVEEGDYVNIDYVGTKDGEEFSGGSAEGYDLGIGTGTFIPGFEDGIIGMKVGEERDLNLTFPKDYGDEDSDLAGADVVFHVTLNKIQRKEDVSYDTFSDEYTAYYSKKNGMTYTSAKELLADIESYLKGTAQNQKHSAISSQVLPLLLQNATFDGYPDGLLEAEIKQTRDYYIKGYGTMYGNLESIGEKVFNLSLKEFEEKIRKETEDNLKIKLILDAIAEKEKIEADETQFASYVQNLMKNNEFETQEDLFLNYADSAEEGEKALKKEYLRVKALSLVADAADVTVEESTETAGNTENE